MFFGNLRIKQFLCLVFLFGNSNVYDCGGNPQTLIKRLPFLSIRQLIGKNKLLRLLEFF